MVFAQVDMGEDVGLGLRSPQPARVESHVVDGLQVFAAVVSACVRKNPRLRVDDRDGAGFAARIGCYARMTFRMDIAHTYARAELVARRDRDFLAPCAPANLPRVRQRPVTAVWIGRRPAARIVEVSGDALLDLRM